MTVFLVLVMLARLDTSVGVYPTKPLRKLYLILELGKRFGSLGGGAKVSFIIYITVEADVDSLDHLLVVPIWPVIEASASSEVVVDGVGILHSRSVQCVEGDPRTDIAVNSTAEGADLHREQVRGVRTAVLLDVS